MEIKIKLSAQDALEIIKDQPANKVLIKNKVPTKNKSEPKPSQKLARKSLSSKLVQQRWSEEEKDWLRNASKPSIANGHHRKVMNNLFGRLRTVKSVSAQWHRMQNN
jgi:hypothetical protein